jgi:eukaryotic-like serine/threonine-protein kinase
MRVLRDLVGHTLSDRYRLVTRLAGGGMGEVFRGQDLLLDRAVAVKVLQPSLAADPDLVERFKQEARLAARLNHPNIVSIHDWGAEDDSTYYMVMEFVPGTDLRDVLILRQSLEVGQALEVAASVCDALATAHRAGLIHRDVKPENILIGRDGDVKVADFGIAVVADAEVTSPGSTIPGTLRYLSPEQLNGEAAGPASDVWAAGAVLFECLTGEPYRNNLSFDQLASAASQEPRVPSELVADLPREIDDIVLRACDPDPDARFDDVAEMGQRIRFVPAEPSEPLESLLTDVTGEVSLADGSPTRYMSGRERRRRGRIRAAALAGVAIAVGALIFSVGQSLFGSNEVKVPKFATTSLTAAKRSAEEQGLVIEVVGRMRRAGTERGEILTQVPATGFVEDGSVVSVTVSEGLPLSRVPRVVGLHLQRARERLNERKLKAGDLDFVYSAKPEGTIVGQEPVDGKLEWRSAVDLVLSRGPRSIPLPTVEGMSLEKAKDVLKEAGFVPVPTEVYSDTVKPGRVVGTDPPGGTSTPEGSEIEVQVSAGPRYDDVKVPEVRGMTVPQARSRLAAIGLRVEVKESCPDGTTVAETDPIPGTVVRENSVVALFVC